MRPEPGQLSPGTNTATHLRRHNEVRPEPGQLPPGTNTITYPRRHSEVCPKPGQFPLKVLPLPLPPPDVLWSLRPLGLTAAQGKERPLQRLLQ